MKTKNNMVVHIKMTDAEYQRISMYAKKHMRTIPKEIKNALKENLLKGVYND